MGLRGPAGESAGLARNAGGGRCLLTFPPYVLHASPSCAVKFPMNASASDGRYDATTRTAQFSHTSLAGGSAGQMQSPVSERVQPLSREAVESARIAVRRLPKKHSASAVIGESGGKQATAAAKTMGVMALLPYCGAFL